MSAAPGSEGPFRAVHHATDSLSQVASNLSGSVDYEIILEIGVTRETGLPQWTTTIDLLPQPFPNCALCML